MQFRLSNLNQISAIYRVSALSSVLVFHGLIGFFIFFSFAPKFQNQQVIAINFVAASSVEKKSSFENNSHQRIVLKKEISPSQNSAQKNSQNSKLLTEKSEKNSKQNDGFSDSSDSQNSAQTEPQFDAAYLNNPSPIYPQIARKQEIEGKVLLVVLVRDDGKPQFVKIYQSSGTKILDEAAIAAVSKWSFIPATRFGQNIAAEVLIPIEFKII